jgi:hypothetical protein
MLCRRKVQGDILVGILSPRLVFSKPPSFADANSISLFLKGGAKKRRNRIERTTLQQTNNPKGLRAQRTNKTE